MADSKYANLSGIAYDQPDVYETNDLPEADQIKEDNEEENDAVEHLSVNVSESFTKFKSYVLSSENVDFSDRLGRQKRTGYGICPGEWELVGTGEKETPLHKYQRLKCELKELMEEITSLKEDESKELPNYVVVNHLEVMNRQLEELRLDKSMGTEMITNLADPQGAQIKKLLCELEKVGGECSSSNTSQTTSTEQTGQIGEVRYLVNSRPRQAQLLQTARLADLEARVAKLNNIVATSPTSIDTLNRLSGHTNMSLLEKSRWIAGKVALLELPQLETVDSRLTTVLNKLDQLADRSAMVEDQDRDNKISELYDLSKSMEGMSQVLPRALDRMMALESLHVQSTNFVKSLSQLEASQNALNISADTLIETLNSFDQKFASSVEALKNNLKEMDSRVKTLSNMKLKNK